MRLLMATDSIDQQVADIERDIDELKTAQFTSQNGGMLAKINRAASYDSFGDIVGWSTSSNPTVVQLSHIPLVATPAMNYFYTVIAEQVFTPANGKPAVVVPLLDLEVKTNGLTGTSQFYMEAQGYGMRMSVRNASNVEVATVNINQSFGELFRPKYSATDRYRYTTNISYASSVAFELSYKFKVRSSDRGSTYSTLKGTW